MSYDDPGKPYQPSNGTDGMCFTDAYCDRCESDALYRETDHGPDGCQILAASMLYTIGEPEYPKEWKYGDDGYPTCTAFEAEVAPEIRAERRERAELEKAGQAALPFPSPRPGGGGE